MELTEWGRVLKPVGIRGQVKLEIWIDDPNTLNRLKKVYIGPTCTKPFCVEQVQKQNDGYAVLKLSEITDRTQAESLRGSTVLIDRNDIQLKKDVNLISDLIGCRILGINSKSCYGIIENVEHYPANDVYTIRLENRICLVPALKIIFPETLIESRIIYCNEEQLLSHSLWSTPEKNNENQHFDDTAANV